MDNIQLVFTFKIIIVGILLFSGSILDIKTRKIHDEIWMLMLAACLPLLAWEMWLKGASDNPVTLLSLAMPLGGMLFIFFGYPEPGKVIKGGGQDILFTLIYLVIIASIAIAFVYGNRRLFTPVLISFIFLAIYFILYQVPIAGTRILHGGADAKCMMALAAIYPWYVRGVPYTVGGFYTALDKISGLGYIFPIHLSILFNAAIVTTVVLVIVIPVLNLIRGDLSLTMMFTNLRMDVDGISGKHVWIVLEHEKKKKVEPTSKWEERLKEMGKSRVWVTPKIPFILSLFVGFIIQMLVGNIMILLFFRF